MNNISVGNWVGETTSTVGQGAILLGGAISGFTTFASIGETQFWYAIIDGNNREAGIGSLSSGVLTRMTIHSNLIEGVYASNPASALSLSGSAEVYSTFNKTAFDQLTDNSHQNFFPDKPIDEPIVIALFGQSNAGLAGIDTPTNLTPNANVFDWSAGGAGQFTAHSWISQDLDAAEYADFNSSLSYTGMKRGGTGHMGWSCADYLQKATGRDVYIICVAHAGQAIAEWAVGQAQQVLISQVVGDALQTPELDGITKIDGVLWMQGESDTGGVVQDYVDAWVAVRAWMELDFVDHWKTMWMISEVSYEFTYSSVHNMHNAVDVQNDEFCRLVRTTSMETVDNIHYKTFFQNEIGKGMARGLLLGPIPKTKS